MFSLRSRPTFGSNSELLAHLRRCGRVNSRAVADVMASLDRANFAGPRCVDPYADCPAPIGSNATISAPHMHAAALEDLAPHIMTPGRPPHILDVGSGSGYLTAALGLLAAGPGAEVVGVEHIRELIDHADQAMERQFGPDARIGSHTWRLPNGNTVTFVEADARTYEGHGAQFDAFHVGAACADFPANLIRLLRRGGIGVVPVNDDSDAQMFWRVERTDAGGPHAQRPQFSRQPQFGVIYVPLTSKAAQVGRSSPIGEGQGI
jgi:protein-L-isoaspartate(D-aspartate) O-methyltransferase